MTSVFIASCFNHLPPSLFLSDARLQTIRGAGHYVYADQPEDFNNRVLEACSKVDWNQTSGQKKEEGKKKTGSTFAAHVKTQVHLLLNWGENRRCFSKTR